MYHITGKDKYKTAVGQTLNKIIQRAVKPKDRWDKSYPESRPLNNFALPMILCNLYNELGDLVPEKEKDQRTHACVNEYLIFLGSGKRG